METTYKNISELIKIDSEKILITSGIDGGIKTILEICTSANDLVELLAPTYAMYKVYANIFQLKLKEIEYTDELKTNFEKIYEFLEEKPKILFIPNPNQPIEDTLTINQIRKIAEVAEKKGCLVVVDEAYHYFGADSSLSLIDEFENIIVARTFSKAFGVPSIRLGFLAANLSNMRKLSKTRLARESN